ncbi:MAG: thermonuclease family protein [Gammaproteobacteria bacterium]|nr:thermonuclease family protein [Gammaproteobacteria bacterium]MDH5803510.1 thermonuclease family protein [Gammaproteobacteria bacterium]
MIKAHTFSIVTIAFIQCISIAAFADTGRVIHVADGDTITILNGKQKTKVRLAEIDAPESKQPYGKKAKQALAGWIAGKMVTVEPVGKDRYGRTIGKVYLDNRYINAAMVEAGYAWFYRKYGKDKNLLELESQARSARRGIWSVAHPIPPWEWRKHQYKSKN